MKLIESKAEYLLQEKGLNGIYRQIELCGRTCYKSTDKMTEYSAKPFVDRMVKSGHTAMLEHGTVYLSVPFKQADNRSNNNAYDIWDKYRNNPYSYVKQVQTVFKKMESEGFVAVTTNLRVLVENGWLDDLQYVCEPTEYHEKRYSFRMVTSIGVTRELNRHRVHSIAEQSTRYCNYSKDKFGNEISVIIPDWSNLVSGNSYDKPIAFRCDVTEGISDLDKEFIMAACCAEESYMYLINAGWQPQQAREVLPLCTATEIVHTAFASDWRHFFDLRLFAKTGNPHPNMLQLARLMQAEAEKACIWDDIMKYPSKFD